MLKNVLYAGVFEMCKQIETENSMCHNKSVQAFKE